MFEHLFDYTEGVTAALDLHPTPGHPAAVAAGVHELLDEALTDDLPAGQYAATIAELARARSRLHALELRLVAAADAAKIHQTTGHTSTGAWLSSQTRTGTAAATRQVTLAGALQDHLPATAAALAHGEVSAEHATVIAHATRQLPDRLTAQQRATVESTLVAKATRLDPVQLRRVARRALAAVEPDPTVVDAHEDQQLADEEDQAHARTRLTLHDNQDGTTSGHFTVPTLAATILRTVLDAMTAPRRTRGTATAWTPDRDPAHARGLAFTNLLEHLPTDHLHTKVAATVIVTLDHDTLTGQLKAAGLDTGDLLSSAQARRLACNAGLVPAVLDGQSQPLDLGRHKRLFSQAQRTAGALLHTTCAAHDCDIPYAGCELHHRQPWSHSGRTDLADLVPLCGHHHRRLHHGGSVPLRT